MSLYSDGTHPYRPVPNTGPSVQTDGLNIVETSGLLNSDGTLAAAYAQYLGTLGAQIG